MIPIPVTPRVPVIVQGDLNIVPTLSGGVLSFTLSPAALANAVNNGVLPTVLTRVDGEVAALTAPAVASVAASAGTATAAAAAAGSARDQAQAAFASAKGLIALITPLTVTDFGVVTTSPGAVTDYGVI